MLRTNFNVCLLIKVIQSLDSSANFFGFLASLPLDPVFEDASLYISLYSCEKVYLPLAFLSPILNLFSSFIPQH